MYGFFLKDVDITMDYAGSFDKYDVIEHLTDSENFREKWRTIPTNNNRQF